MKILKLMQDVEALQHLDKDYFKLMKYYRDYGENFQYGAIETYDKCSYRCIYCITESQGKSRPRVYDDPDLLEAQFQKEVSQLNKHWVICMCAAADPYNELEEKLRLTRRAIEVCLRNNLRFTVTTKGTSILNDLDLYHSIDPSLWYKLIISFSTLDPELSAKVEPGAPSPKERIDALRTLYREGFPEVWAGISPWIPEVTNLEEIFDTLPEGIPVWVQPLEIGEEFEEPLDQKRMTYSSRASLGKKWTFNEINYHYVAECNRLFDRYKKKFPVMEWRWPIFKDTHGNDRGYFRQLKPGRFQPEDFLVK